MSDCIFCKIAEGEIPSSCLWDEEGVFAFEVIAKLAEREGRGSGYRVISNCGPDAGQTVPHLHFHVLAGKKMAERMV